MSSRLAVVRGRSPLLLVAPHAGRRDTIRRPWGSEPLKMNDLHTGSLTRELADVLDASAILNDGGDRNDVDWNRISDACDRAPEFLDALADALDAILAVHRRATVLTIHGWNVAQPAVDMGLGARPSSAVLRGGGETAVSAEFAATILPHFAAALDGRGIAATPGLRYPARARENLVQLFTGRHRGDPRAPVGRLAALGERIDAVQLELSLPLRAPGAWRDAFVSVCRGVFGPAAVRPPAVAWPPWEPPSEAGLRAGLEFVAPGLSGLVALDEHGGRLLLFRDDGRLVTFTGERVGRHATSRVAGLGAAPDETGALDVAYRGPMLEFPDTTPFLDLEHGLACASVIEAEVTLRLVASHRDDASPCPVGDVTGRVRLGDEWFPIDGCGQRAGRRGPGASSRVSLRLSDDTAIVARGTEGVLCRRSRHVELTDVTTDHHVGEGIVRIAARASEGRPIDVTADVVHRLPVVFGSPAGARLLFASCRIGRRLAGWVELPWS